MAQKKITKKAKPVAATPSPATKSPKIYVSPKVDLSVIDSDFTRADIIFDGVDHGGVTFEARVFLNNDAAAEKTPKNAASGYAGSFHIFGHGGCFGDAGHCEVRGTPRPYDPRPAHMLTPAKKTLIATDAIRRALNKGKVMSVTIVPVVRAGTSKCDYENVVKFDKISVITYK